MKHNTKLFVSSRKMWCIAKETAQGSTRKYSPRQLILGRATYCGLSQDIYNVTTDCPAA